MKYENNFKTTVNNVDISTGELIKDIKDFIVLNTKIKYIKNDNKIEKIITRECRKNGQLKLFGPE